MTVADIKDVINLRIKHIKSRKAKKELKIVLSMLDELKENNK